MIVKIAILCNDRLGLPAINQLIASGMVVALAMPDYVSEMQYIMQQQCANANIPFRIFSKSGIKTELKKWVEQYNPDMVLVKTFPWLIPADVLHIPKHGFINFHYAPLPEWRGGSPLFWMIRNSVPVGGVTVHRMDEQYDTGPLLLQQAVNISSDTTYGMLCTQLAYTGLQLTSNLLQHLHAGTLAEIPQTNSQAKWYSRPQPSDLFINWNTMTSDQVKALVKACNPWNKGAATQWKGWTFGIVDASVLENDDAEKHAPGTIIQMDEKNGMQIVCKDKKIIKAEVVYCEEAFLTGDKLTQFGLKKFEQLAWPFKLYK